jgi:hypothetical protein
MDSTSTHRPRGHPAQCPWRYRRSPAPEQSRAFSARHVALPVVNMPSCRSIKVCMSASRGLMRFACQGLSVTFRRPLTHLNLAPDARQREELGCKAKPECGAHDARAGANSNRRLSRRRRRAAAVVAAGEGGRTGAGAPGSRVRGVRKRCHALQRRVVSSCLGLGF